MFICLKFSDFETDFYIKTENRIYILLMFCLNFYYILFYVALCITYKGTS